MYCEYPFKKVKSTSDMIILIFIFFLAYNYCTPTTTVSSKTTTAAPEISWKSNEYLIYQRTEQMAGMRITNPSLPQKQALHQPKKGTKGLTPTVSCTKGHKGDNLSCTNIYAFTYIAK